MPYTDPDSGPDQTVASVLERYRRTERTLRLLIGCLAGGLAVGAIVLFPLVAGTAVAVALVLALRAPVLKPRGRTRLVTDADPAAVGDAFAGPRPPLLAFQWGVADTVERRNDCYVYEFTALLGLQQAEIAAVSHRTDLADQTERVELHLTESGEPWATYEVTVTDDGSQTVVDVEWESQRRFGLVRLSQALAGKRHRTAVLAAQGYEVETTETTLV